MGLTTGEIVEALAQVMTGTEYKGSEKISAANALLTWADPEAELVYVFLSNRTYPSSTNRLLVKSELRTRIQQVIYDAILKHQQPAKPGNELGNLEEQ